MFSRAEPAEVCSKKYQDDQFVMKIVAKTSNQTSVFFFLKNFGDKKGLLISFFLYINQ